MEIIKLQWGAIINSNNIIKDSHVKNSLESIDNELFSNEVFVKYEISEKAVTIYGYGNRKNDNVKLFTRSFRKALRKYGHTLEGNVWLYGEKEHIVKNKDNNSVIV